MNEKLLPTTAGTLEEKAIKNALNSVYGTYGTYSAADVRPTCMNDQVWMDIGGKCISSYACMNRADILYAVNKELERTVNTDKCNIRVLVGGKVMKALAMLDGYIPDHMTVDGLLYQYDHHLNSFEFVLQQKRVTMRYDQFFKPKPFDIYKDAYSANELSSSISSGIENLRKKLKEAFGELFNLEENNMSRKSLEVKKVIYSGPCTIVIWADDSKTIVRCQDGDTYSKEVGLLMCLAKKVWGTNASGSNFNDYISKVISEKEENK